MDNVEQQLTKKERREARRQEKLQKRDTEERRQRIRRAIIWVVVLLVIGGGIAGIVSLARRAPAQDTSSGGVIAPLAQDDWVKGGREAKIVLIEYSDFQCPACKTYHPLLKKLTEEFGDKIAFVYRFFPLRQIHKNADLASQAAQAAGLQGKFWEMHDLIFDHQRDWAEVPKADVFFIGYAESLALDMNKFKNDIDSEAVKKRVDGDYQGGIDAGINSTPTFYLNGKKMQNPRSYEEFSKIISDAIAASP